MSPLRPPTQSSSKLYSSNPVMKKKQKKKLLERRRRRGATTTTMPRLLITAFLLFSLLPTTAVEGAVYASKSGFDRAFDTLASNLPDLEAFDNELPVIGMSINDLVTYDGGSGVRGFLRHILLGEVVGGMEEGKELAGVADRTADALVAKLNRLLGIDATKGCGPSLGKRGDNNFADLPRGKSGFEITVTKEDSGFIDEMDVGFCIGFTKKIAVTTGSAFDKLEETLAIEAKGGATIEVNAYLKLGGSMKVLSHTQFGIWDMEIEAGLFIDSDANLDISLGMLDLQSSAKIQMFGLWKLKVCNKKYQKCDTSDPALVNPKTSTSYKLYMLQDGAYKVEGDIRLGTDFGLPGLTIGDGYFLAEDLDLFDDDKTPEVTIRGPSKDVSLFSPSNAITLLYMLDSVLTRVQENEAVAGVKLPLSNKKVSDVLATGSIITNKLNELFIKVEDFDDRGVKSLVRTGDKDFDFSKAGSVQLKLDLVMIKSDLNVMVTDYAGIQKLAAKKPNQKCTFSVKSPSSTSDLLSQMKAGIKKCSLKVCDAPSSPGSVFTTDYLQVGRLRNRKEQNCLDPDGGDAKGQSVRTQPCGTVKSVFESDVMWAQEEDSGLIHNLKSLECLDIDSSLGEWIGLGKGNDITTTECDTDKEDMKWDLEYVKGSKKYFMLRNRANRELCLVTKKENGSSGLIAQAYPCDHKKERFHWYWDRPAGTESQCFNTKTGDFAWCDCDVVLGKDAKDEPFVATTAYSDKDNSIPNDVRLLALMETKSPTKVVNHFGFDMNEASTLTLIPRFSNWAELIELVNTAIQESLPVTGLEFTLKYVPEAVIYNNIPARIEIYLGFGYEVVRTATFDTSLEIGDLADIHVEDGMLSLGARVEVGTNLAIWFAPSQFASLAVALETPCDDFLCPDMGHVAYKLEYQYMFGGETETMYGNLTDPYSSGSPATAMRNDATLWKILSSVEERGNNTLVLKFLPTIRTVTITPAGRLCQKTGTHKEDTVVVEYDCPKGYSFKKVVENDYGLVDVSQTKTPYQITIGETAFNAGLEVGGDVTVVTNIGGVLEAVANINADFSGELELKANPGGRFHLDFAEWLADLSAIKSKVRQQGFFEAAAHFEGEITGQAAGSFPFDGIEASFAGSLQKYSIDFLAPSGSNKPHFELEVDLPSIGNIKKMSFGDVVALLETALELLVGDDEDKVEALKSCSGGLLGKEIAGKKIFLYPIPVVGLSVCQSAGHLHTFVSAVNKLVEESKPGANMTFSGTFSSLETQLSALLTDEAGGEPTVTITPSDTANASSLEVDIVLEYSFYRVDDLLIGLESILESYSADEDDAAIISAFTNEMIPGAGAKIELGGSLTFTLALGLEYHKASKAMKPYVKGTTGLDIGLYADTSFSFAGSIGPLKGFATGEVKLGDGPTRPLTLSAGLDGDENTRHYLTNSRSLASLKDKFDLSFGGSISAYVEAATDDLFFPFGVPKLEGSITCAEIDKLIRNEDGGCALDFNFTGPPALEIPTFFDMLLKDPQSLVEAVDDIFDRVERATLGSDGIITRFPVPIIQKGIGDALGAGKEDNILANVRRNVVQAFQERLDLYEQETGSAPATTVDFLTQELQKLLSNDSVDLISPGKKVTVSCFEYDEHFQKQMKLASCGEGNPTSLMWTVPFGQEYSIELDLDFSLDAGNFPLAIGLSGGSAPKLGISWEFTLGFGFDAKKGFFLSTEVEGVDDTENASEFQVQTWFTLEDKTLDARLFFLSASMSELDIHVAAGFFVDIVKPKEIDKPGPMKGRIARSDWRLISRPSDLFTISAIAGATVQTKLTTAVDLGSHFDEVTKFIPSLEGRIAVQARKQFSTVDSRRRLVSDFDRRRLGTLARDSFHPAHGLFRWLAEDVEDDGGPKQILAHDFGSNWDACPVGSKEHLCAVITDVQLDVKSIRDAIVPITSKLVNGDRTGYFDKVIKPLLPLGKPLPGISEVTKCKLTPLDIADMYYPKSGAKTVMRVLEMYEQMSTFVRDLEDTGTIPLASRCDIVRGFVCDSDTLTSRYLEEDWYYGEEEEERPALLMLRGHNRPNVTQSHARALARRKRKGNKVKDCSKAKTKAQKVVCKASQVEGLSFPFLKNPASALNLLQGGDIRLVEFTPPEINFGFYKELNYLLYPWPKITIGVYFEFSTTVKYGLVLDSKGIREAITQREPLKALNSFALMDTFDGVDLPVMTITARVGVILSVSIFIAKVTVSGGVRLDAAIDLYDPYPDTSGGLVRPYEMLSISLNPLKWLEFTLSMVLELIVSIKVRINFGFFSITLFSYKKRWSTQLIDPIIYTPPPPPPIVECQVESREMVLVDPGHLSLECTGLGGELGSEMIECLLDKPQTKEDPIQNCQTVSKVIAAEAGGIDNLLLRDIKSHSDVTKFGAITKLELDYKGFRKVDEDLIFIDGSKASIGHSVVDFDSASTGVLVLPDPELPFLKTSFAGQCNTAWTLEGFTNLEVKVAQIDSRCAIVAPGGTGASDLVIDFAPSAPTNCSDGNHITVSKDEDDDTFVTIKQAGKVKDATIKVGENFHNINIKMTDCKDVVEIFKTADSTGTVSITANAGDDQVTVGNDKTGTDEIYKKVVVHGGKGKNSLIVNDSGGLMDKPTGELRSQSLGGLLNGSHRAKQSAKCSLDSFEKHTFRLGDETGCYEIQLGLGGLFHRGIDSDRRLTNKKRRRKKKKKKKTSKTKKAGREKKNKPRTEKANKKKNVEQEKKKGKAKDEPEKKKEKGWFDSLTDSFSDISLFSDFTLNFRSEKFWGDDQCGDSEAEFAEDYSIGTFKYLDTLENKAYYENGSHCYATRSARRGHVSLVTDDSIESPSIEVSEPSTCVYEAVLTVPSSACANDQPRHKSQLEFNQISHLKVKLSSQKNRFKVEALPHGATVEITGEDEETSEVLLGQKFESLSLKGVKRGILFR